MVRRARGLQSLETTTSGYLGGLPLRILLGYRPELIAQRLGLRAIPPERVLLVDARDLDPAEVEFLARTPIDRSTVDEVSAANLPDGPLYLHLDGDVADPADLPDLLFPAPGGPSLSAVAAAVVRVLATGRVAAFGIACTWHPGHHTGARLAQALPLTLRTTSRFVHSGPADRCSGGRSHSRDQDRLVHYAVQAERSDRRYAMRIPGLGCRPYSAEAGRGLRAEGEDR